MESESLKFNAPYELALIRTNRDGNSLLHVAVLKQNKEAIRFLIDAGIDVNLKNENNETALNIAMKCKNPTTKSGMMKMLVTAGADANTTIRSRCRLNHESALHVAAELGDVELAKLLIRHGAKVNGACKMTPLHYAAKYVSSEDPSIFKVLLAAKSNVNARGSRDDTPLHFLSDFQPEDPPIPLCKIVDVFLKYGADINIEDKYGYRPIDRAIYGLNSEAVKALVLCGGVDVNSRFMSGEETILHAACDNFDLRSVKFLLVNGANIDALDDENKTPLRYAIESNMDGHSWRQPAEEIKFFRYFLKWNPNVNVITTDGFNILTGHNKLSDYLWKIILEHLCKLSVVGGVIDPSLIETISYNSNYKAYFEKCSQELEAMKNSLLHHESWVSLLNLLIDNKKKLFQYTGNKNFYYLNSLVVTDFFDNFPIYGSVLRKRFLTAMEQRKIWDQAAVALCNLLPITNLDPNHRIVVHVLKFFNSEELIKLYE